VGGGGDSVPAMLPPGVESGVSVWILPGEVGGFWEGKPPRMKVEVLRRPGVNAIGIGGPVCLLIVGRRGVEGGGEEGGGRVGGDILSVALNSKGLGSGGKSE